MDQSLPKLPLIMPVSADPVGALLETLPHPDHVIIDFDAGTARIAGPMTREEKAQYDDILARRDQFKEDVNDLIEDRKTCDDPKLLARIDDHIRQSRKIIEIIDARLGRRRRARFLAL